MDSSAQDHALYDMYLAQSAQQDAFGTEVRVISDA